MTDLLDLKGRYALITGAGQGVGRQAALHFASSGAAGIVVNDFHLERAVSVVKEIEEAGGKAIAVQADITNLAAVEAMVQKGIDAFGQIDILVNNAGNAGPVQDVSKVKPFWESSPEDWNQFVGTNFFGVLNCCKAALPGMMARKYGRVITVISDAGRVGEPHLAVYSGAKAGAAGFMRALAKAVGRANVTANCVALSGIRTPGIAGMLSDENVAQALKSYVIRRLGEPEDAANLILFLASDAASWITGQTYPVNGGYAFSV
ncbi:MAG: oxidoreductase [Hydrocarboniphaga sp.]|uniref:SDR family NAD(P)-dependent oxidoreductase n=1 Tax=Hydrocarboniphaga sp. TaxID=2033016 RepID=UPI00260AB6ED|nr:SDR family NAD(P)-dependent oxidoreductase [Hydrocarboniphaga sp.]MDB5971139.1 oxidoreductase [Hydrocarboniphaga sp.]